MTENSEKSPPTGCCGGAVLSAPKTPFDRWMAHIDTVVPASAAVQAALLAELVAIPGGFFDMGARQSRHAADFDSPRRKVTVAPYRMAATTVTNRQFARFVEMTGYRTIAEIEGWSFVFHLLLADPKAHPASPPGLHWWRQVKGAYWAQPEGPVSSVASRPDEPAVHISWFDAMAYCRWSGLRLPTEAEWERAARGGGVHQRFAWGQNLLSQGRHMMNVWQGRFPDENSAEDGYIGPAPVRSYPPNAYGLYQMTGNVWEWCQDWFAPHPALLLRNPTGPARGVSKVMRGGSYLCHDSYCDRYQLHSRNKNDPDSSSGNLGFRVAANAIFPGQCRISGTRAQPS